MLSFLPSNVAMNPHAIVRKWVYLRHRSADASVEFFLSHLMNDL